MLGLGIEDDDLCAAQGLQVALVLGRIDLEAGFSEHQAGRKPEGSHLGIRKEFFPERPRIPGQPGEPDWFLDLRELLLAKVL